MRLIEKTFQLSKKERKELEKHRKNASDRRIYRRLCALLWLDSGRTQEEVAELLGVTARTIRDWIALYRKGGLKRLCVVNNHGRECDLNADQQEELRAKIRDGHFRSAKQVRRWIEEKFGQTYSLSGTQALLRRLGASFHKTSALMFRADPEKQKEFLKKIPTTKTETTRGHAALLH